MGSERRAGELSVPTAKRGLNGSLGWKHKIGAQPAIMKAAGGIGIERIRERRCG